MLSLVKGDIIHLGFEIEFATTFIHCVIIKIAEKEEKNWNEIKNS